MWQLGRCSSLCYRSLSYLTVISLFISLIQAGNLHPTHKRSISAHRRSNYASVSTTVKARPRIRENFTSSDEEYGLRVATMTLNGIGVFLNTLLIIAIIVDPLKILRRGVWLTILNLAIADFIVCLSNISDVGMTFEFGVRDPVMLRIVRFLLTFGVGASFMLLTVLTVETYIATRYPIRGRLILTRKKLGILCVVAWLLAVPIGLSNIAYLFSNNFQKLLKIYIAQIAVLELAVLIQVVLKVLIIRELMKSRRDIAVHVQRRNNHKEIAKTIIMLNVILLVTALPFFVSKQLEFLWKLDLLSGDPLIWKFTYYYEPIAALNYLANPILYALRLPDYKRTLSLPFNKCKVSCSTWFFKCVRCKRSVTTTTASFSLRMREQNT